MPLSICVIKTLSVLGYILPDDFSVIEFEDIAKFHVTSLESTMIHVPIKQIANEAIQLIK